MPAPYSALDIAKWFLWRNRLEEVTGGGEPLTVYKLAKLVYYAEGSSLALGNGSLYDDPIRAWSQGPMLDAVWEHYGEYNVTGIPYDVKECERIGQSMGDREGHLLEAVFEVFGGYSGWKLREIVCSEKPWLEAGGAMHKLGGEISRETMCKQIKEDYIGK